MEHNKAHSHDHGEHDHTHGVYEEVLCHFPYAVFSVAFCLTILSFMTYFSAHGFDHEAVCRSSHMLFHNFHFMHLVFATTGSVITSLRFSQSVRRAIVVGIFSPLFFCILSDVILPYIGGTILQVPMTFHICIYSELHNVLPFMVFGIINGFAMSTHAKALQGHYSIFSHFVHILVSSFASVFYLVSHGFTNWYESIGAVFVFLTLAVVIPCTMSDVVVPMAFAKKSKDNEKHTS